MCAVADSRTDATSPAVLTTMLTVFMVTPLPKHTQIISKRFDDAVASGNSADVTMCCQLMSVLGRTEQVSTGPLLCTHTTLVS